MNGDGRESESGNWARRSGIGPAPAFTLVFGLAFLEPPAAAFDGRRVPALLLVRFRLELRDLDGTTVPVHGNERQIARVGVAAPAGEQLLCLNADPDLHRRLSREVDARLHDDQVA